MRSDRVGKRLLDIRDNIFLARAFVGQMSLEEFAADRKTFYATVRALEIISEASRGLSEEMKARYAEIDWVAVRDSGNVYRHSYELVTEERIYDTVTKRLDELDRAITAEIERLS